MCRLVALKAELACREASPVPGPDRMQRPEPARHQTTLASKEQVPTNTREIDLGRRFIAASSRAGMTLGTLCGASYALIDDINEEQNGDDQKT
ncbi:hypothetical protein REMIM1_CH04174 [Rhizobium etli bv. mimosae str. Mim1]|nr:hypothetical protein REMIM1_CH04174 [Rhizobium etli bv. mimosae str. Mim1]